MPNSVKKRPVNVDKEVFEKFDYLYPDLVSLFINRSLILALQDKKYFEEVFFNELFIGVK